MVIRGKSRGDGRQLGYYLLSTKENERVKVLEVRGTAFPNDIVKSLLEMEYTVELTDGKYGLFHAQLNPSIEDDKKLTYKDWIRMADIAEEEYGLKNQKRVIVQHEKKGRLHCHVVWERYDHEKGILRTDSYSHYKGSNARERIQEELDFTRRTPWRNRGRQENIKTILQPIWAKTKTAEAFINKAREVGYETVTSQNKRPFMVVEMSSGRSFDLVRNVKAKTKDVRDRFRHKELPTDKQIITQVRARQHQEKLNLMQEKAIDKMDEFRNKQEGKQSQKKLTTRLEKAGQMKENMKPDKDAQKQAFKEDMKKALDKDKEQER